MKKFLQKLNSEHPLLTEMFRFLLVGGTATVVDMLVMALVQYLLEPELYTNLLSIFTAKRTGYVYIAGTACGFLVGLLVNYALSVLFVFEHKGKSRSAYGFLVFAALSLSGLGLHILGMYVGNTLLGFNAWLVKIAMTALVLVYNYTTKRLILFRKGKKTAPAPEENQREPIQEEEEKKND